MPTPDMEMKGGNFTFMTKGSGNTQTETSALQAVFASHGKKSSAPNGCRHKKHASRAPSLGNISKRQDPTLLGCNSGPNQSGSDPCHGVVRPGSPHCLEPHLPPHTVEPTDGFFPFNGSGMAELEEPLVDVPHGHPITPGRESICVGRASIGFAGVNGKDWSWRWNSLKEERWKRYQLL